MTLFCIVRRRALPSDLRRARHAAAFILGCGRIGNFIDGQIVGSVTTLPWGVQVSGRRGIRHPVVLYDGLKNFLIIPILWSVQRRGVPPGRIASLFVLLYAGLRIPIDMLREYPIAFLFMPAGQTFNVIMALAGITLLLKNIYWPAPTAPPSGASDGGGTSRSYRLPRLAFAAVVALALIIPSDATRDIPARYAHRHEGLTYSWMYPRIGVEP